MALEGKAGNEIPESDILRFQFLEKFFANSFALSKAEDNISGWLNTGGMADLPFLLAQLEFC